jgi:hypothetical protein
MTNGMVARLTAVVGFAVLAAGCSVAAGIFRAGFWVGLILAIVIVVGVRMLFRGRR